jgi:hypothetical protein
VGATRKLVGFVIVLAGVFTIGYLSGFVSEKYEAPPEPLAPPPPAVTHTEHGDPPGYGVQDGTPK